MRARASAAVLLASLAAFAALAAEAQEIRHEASAVNIEVPVRVFKDGRFVDGLTLADFEVLEDGRPQKIEAFYLVKKTIIERSEEPRAFAPRTARHFYLIFELGDYDARVLEALDYFVKSVLLPGDNLTLVTPLKTYRMKGELFGLVGRKNTYDQIAGLLRRDIGIGYSESREILAEMTDLARVIASDVRSRDAVAGTLDAALVEPVMTVPVDSAFNAASIEVQLMNYSTLLDRLTNLRVVDQAKLLGFAEHLKSQAGQKGVFFFYQRELLPKIDPRIVDELAAKYSQRPEITQSLETIFGLDRRDLVVNVDLVTKAYADAAAAIHFLHITRPVERPEGIRMEERSEDIFAPFLEMARVTGGYAASTANVAEAMRTAVEASENYYLLYYTPAAYRPDGRFHNIAVRVRSQVATISHRLGYIAD